MWHKFQRSQILLRFENMIFSGSKSLTKYPVQFELGNLQNFVRLMGHIKMGCKNIFNTKTLFGVSHICHFDSNTVINLCRLEMWSGLEVFWRTSKKEGESTVWSLCRNWITSWYHFVTTFSHLISQQNKYWKLSTLTKSLKKGLMALLT